MPRNSYDAVNPYSVKASGYNPNQLGPDDYDRLIAEIREQGRLLKPVVCRKVDGELVILDGEHNWRAACEVGLDEIPIELIEVDDECEAVRQTIVRNKIGKRDNLRLGRCYAKMLNDRPMSNGQLGDMLRVSEGSVRNQLLYPECWDLLREKGERLINDAGQAINPETYRWDRTVYDESTIAGLTVRDLRALVASLQGLADYQDEAADQPGAAEPEARMLARFKRTWNKMSEDERGQGLEWAGVTADIAQLVKDAREQGYRSGFDEGHDIAIKAQQARAQASINVTKVEPAGEQRNGYAKRGARIREARHARGLTGQQLADLADVKSVSYVSLAENAKVSSTGRPRAGDDTYAKLEAALGL